MPDPLIAALVVVGVWFVGSLPVGLVLGYVLRRLHGPGPQRGEFDE